MSNNNEEKLNYYLVSYSFYSDNRQGSGNHTQTTKGGFNQDSIDCAKENIRKNLDKVGKADCGFAIMCISFLGKMTKNEFNSGEY